MSATAVRYRLTAARTERRLSARHSPAHGLQEEHNTGELTPETEARLKGFGNSIVIANSAVLLNEPLADRGIGRWVAAEAIKLHFRLRRSPNGAVVVRARLCIRTVHPRGARRFRQEHRTNEGTH